VGQQAVSIALCISGPDVHSNPDWTQQGPTTSRGLQGTVEMGAD